MEGGVYGTQVAGSQWRPLRSVIGQVEATGSGNVILRIGREFAPDGGWTQTEHVVLSPAEAAHLIDDLRFALRPGGGLVDRNVGVDVVGRPGQPIDDRHPGDRHPGDDR